MGPRCEFQGEGAYLEGERHVDTARTVGPGQE